MHTAPASGLTHSSLHSASRCCLNACPVQANIIIALLLRAQIGLHTGCAQACMHKTLHNFLRNTSRGLHACPTQANIIIALLQPSPETYDIFDDLLLMGDGKVGLMALMALMALMDGCGGSDGSDGRM